MSAARNGRSKILAAGIAALLLSACDEVAPEPETGSGSVPAVSDASSAPAVPVPPPQEVRWDSSVPATMEVTPAGIKVGLSEKGMVNAVYFDLPVEAGETIVAKLDISGDVDKLLRVVLIRHCDPANGDEGASEGFKLTAEPKPVAVKHTFAKKFGCVRLSFLSQDGSPMNALLANVVIGKE